jgi:hypothetical protein
MLISPEISKIIEPVVLVEFDKFFKMNDPLS